MAPNDTLIGMAKATSVIHGLDPALVCAVCEWESQGWNQWAMRFEPAFFSKYIMPQYAKLGATEAYARGFSYGLMQVMGQVAREFGFAGKFLTQLCDPATGLEFGCRKLGACVDKHPGGDLRGALLQWNGGADLTYPDHVLPLMEKYR